MSVIRYKTRHGSSQVDEVTWPDWDAIETAIRRMDRCLFPQVWLHTEPAADSGYDVPELEVIGGDSAYVVTLQRGGDQLVLQNPGGGSKQVAVWTSDQGASFAESEVCPSLDEVLRVVRHFYDHGEEAPQTRWA